MTQRAVDSMVKQWGIDPTAQFTGHRLGTGISACVFRSPDAAERVLHGTDEDVFILAYHRSVLNDAEMLLDTDAIYDGHVGQGSWLIVPPNRKPRARVQGDWEVMHLYIPADFVQDVARDISHEAVAAMAQRCIHLIRDRTLTPLLHRVYDEATQDSVNAIQLESLCAQASAALLTAYGRSRSAERAVRERLAPWQIKRVHSLIETQGLAALTVSDLCDAVRLSRSHLSRAWRAETGGTLRDSIVQRRIQAAQTMLSTGDQTMTEVALACGFSSPSHFAATFRSVTGQTPSAYRANMVSEAEFSG